ncbi:MAG: hypothetical protein GX306_06145 [Clostridiales bacterium]|nr:hypothetical protein [Clostridiales bacterium]
MFYQWKKLFNPEIFQGKYKKRNYFEGWYYKLFDSTFMHPLIIIPGISMNQSDSHSFIQIIYQGTEVDYIRYDLTDFRYSEKEFALWIGDNYFTKNQINLHILSNKISIQGKLSFYNRIGFPKTLYHPGIMGPFSYLPIMECYHGIVNIHHQISGKLMIAGESINYDKGYGYIEKDWGTSFPKRWIWFQSSHFPKGKVTVQFSVAEIPFLGTSFEGFLSIFRYKNNIILFATYTGARIRYFYKSDTYLWITIQDLRFCLEIGVVAADGIELKAPIKGIMKRTILETTFATIRVRLSTRQGKLLYEGNGKNTGLEIVGY